MAGAAREGRRARGFRADAGRGAHVDAAVGFYSERILPRLIRAAMRDERFTPFRQRNVARACGRVLEVGIGAGENLRHYGEHVSEVIGLEPSAPLATSARATAARVAFPVSILEQAAEVVPLDSASIDTVVVTWTLCSIAEPRRALAEMRRVLKPDGSLVFVEHGLAPHRLVRSGQRGLTPVWRRFAGGCHLDRAVPDLIRAAGFVIERLETGYMSGPRLFSFMYEGAARPN